VLCSCTNPLLRTPVQNLSGETTRRGDVMDKGSNARMRWPLGDPGPGLANPLPCLAEYPSSAFVNLLRFSNIDRTDLRSIRPDGVAVLRRADLDHHHEVRAEGGILDRGIRAFRHAAAALATLTNCAPTASRDCCRGGRTPDGVVRSGWRAYRWQNGASEAYESIGVDGNRVMSAIRISCSDRGACEPSLRRKGSANYSST
jgi:hypothetical protein